MFKTTKYLPCSFWYRCLSNLRPNGRRWVSNLSTPGETHASPNFSLRPYQEECIKACVSALGTGYSRLGVSLPTGAGKTTVFISLLAQIEPRRSEATRCLIVVNSIELAFQAADQARRLLPRCSVEIEQGARHFASGLADM